MWAEGAGRLHAVLSLLVVSLNSTFFLAPSTQIVNRTRQSFNCIETNYFSFYFSPKWGEEEGKGRENKHQLG